jgi:hypothetical protein
MSHVDCTFHLNNFQLDSPWGEDDVFFLILWGEGMSLELYDLDVDVLGYLISEIESGMRLSEKGRREHEVDEPVYQPPEPVPNRLRFCFDSLLSLQALYQPGDRLWQMVFEDGDDGSQAHVMMSTQQVSSLLERLKETVAEGLTQGGDNDQQ